MNNFGYYKGGKIIPGVHKIPETNLHENILQRKKGNLFVTFSIDGTCQEIEDFLSQHTDWTHSGYGVGDTAYAEKRVGWINKKDIDIYIIEANKKGWKVSY